MFNLFITEPALTKIILSEKEKKPKDQSYLYKLLRMQKTIYTTAIPANAVWTPANKALKEVLNIKQAEYIRNIAAHPETVLRNPSSLFFLDISPVEAENIRKSYGVFCMSGNYPYISSLLDTNDEHTTNEREPFAQGWSTVLQSLRDIPSNALLISDRYLFSTLSASIGNGIANVYAILEELLPHRFLGEYHVTVVFDVEIIHESYTFEDIATRLDHIKQSLHRDYPIVMEVLGITTKCPIYDRLHNRRIVSNYYIVKAEHKLAAFNGNKATSQQSITPQVLFTVDSLNGHSTPPLKSINQMASALRDFSRWIHSISDHSLYHYAVNGEWFERCWRIKNRMIN